MTGFWVPPQTVSSLGTTKKPVAGFSSDLAAAADVRVLSELELRFRRHPPFGF